MYTLQIIFFLYFGKRCRYALPARTVTKKVYVSHTVTKVTMLMWCATVRKVVRYRTKGVSSFRPPFVLRNEYERRILVAEMSWLRIILGRSRRDKIQNEATRKELRQENTLTDKIKERRLTWVGHVTRMEGNSLRKKLNFNRYSLLKFLQPLQI